MSESNLNYNRQIIINMFIGTLKRKLKDVYKVDKVTKMATKMEHSCYNYVIHTCLIMESPPMKSWDDKLFVDIYADKAGIINQLLRNDLYSDDIIAKIESKEINISKIAFMTSIELVPQYFSKYSDLNELRMKQDIVKKRSNIYKCPSCKANDCQYWPKQMKAADEATNFLCLCVCGNTFIV